ncbi:MAG: serine/threonine protein kinase [Sandaracinaceae bacterium]|nr:serine/threonine protein kinase [Sandaracinaceae bacterium]
MAAPEDDPAGSAPAIGTVLEGRYELVARLGEGGVGWVYRAKHLRLGTDVAIKMLQAPYDHHESLRPRFEREAQALAQLRHPNIVTMTDYSVADGRPYLVMERLEGRTLAELLEHGPLPEARARRILRQVLDALIYAHGRGFAHRDLKPSNIFLVELPTDPDHVKILDFGFVKLMRDVDGGKRPALTVSGIAFGTPSYMCPEQATGAPTDPRADLYSAGIVLYEMLSGRRPFVGEIPEVIRAHLTEPVPRLVVGELEAGRELRAFLERALAKAPADRFQTAGEMRAALDALPTPGLVRESELRALEQAPTVPPPAPVRGAARAPRPPAPRRSRPIGIVIAIILLIAGGSFAIYLAIEDGGAGRREASAGPAGDVPDEGVVGASPRRHGRRSFPPTSATPSLPRSRPSRRKRPPRRRRARRAPSRRSRPSKPPATRPTSWRPRSQATRPASRRPRSQARRPWARRRAPRRPPRMCRLRPRRRRSDLPRRASRSIRGRAVSAYRSSTRRAVPWRAAARSARWASARCASTCEITAAIPGPTSCSARTTSSAASIAARSSATRSPSASTPARGSIRGCCPISCASRRERRSRAPPAISWCACTVGTRSPRSSARSRAARSTQRRGRGSRRFALA